MGLSRRHTQLAGKLIEPRRWWCPVEGKAKVTDQFALDPAQESATDRHPEPAQTHAILLGLFAHPPPRSPKTETTYIPDVK